MRAGISIAVVGALLAGCVVSSSSNDEGHITASWSFRQVEPEAELDCPVGYDLAALYVQAADSAGNPIGTCDTASDTCVIDTFPCSDAVGVSESLPPSNYLTWVTIEDDTGANVYGSSVTALVDITTVDKTFEVNFIDNGGYFHLSWQLRGDASGQPLTCAGAGALGGIDTLATATATGVAYDYTYDCSDGDDFLPPLPQGDYALAVTALDGSGVPIGPPVGVAATMGDHDAVVDLGMLTLSVTGL